MRPTESAARITSHLETALARALSSMTGKEFTVSSERSPEAAELDTPIVWQQSFSFDPDQPVLWLVAGRDLWMAVGQMTLAAVGIDAVTEDDCRSTWAEIAGHAIGNLSMAMTSDLQREITAAGGEDIATEPADVAWISLTAGHDNAATWLLKVGWLPALAGQYERSEPEHKAAAVSVGSNFSKTFDLLLDVALPVAVSFGKTSLQIREVLKLNTGSIVELNRLVIEPVDVVVNDCVIARGEVVVVDGNYGVRVTQLASREDRMRFGIADTSGRTGLTPGAGD